MTNERPPTRREPRRLSPKGRQTLALGTIAVAGVVLAGCGEEPPSERLFSSVDDCVTSGFERTVCEGEFQRAMAVHAEDAPRFDGLAACEAEYGEGKCVERPTEGEGGTGASNGGSGFFTPFLTGYLVSNALNNLSDRGSYDRYLRDNPTYRPDPIYRTRSGTPVTVARDLTPGAADRVTGTSTTRSVSTPTRTRPVNVNTRTVSRRGFGGRGFGRSGGFGG